jgi:hypothetical protein
MFAGNVESTTVEGETVRSKGWAADLSERSMVDRVVLFAGGTLVFSSATTVYRWDIDELQKKTGNARVGFVAEVPLREIRGKRLRAFAVRGGVATELEGPNQSASIIFASAASP